MGVTKKERLWVASDLWDQGLILIESVLFILPNQKDHLMAALVAMFEQCHVCCSPSLSPVVNKCHVSKLQKAALASARGEMKMIVATINLNAVSQVRRMIPRVRVQSHEGLLLCSALRRECPV